MSISRNRFVAGALATGLLLYFAADLVYGGPMTVRISPRSLQVYNDNFNSQNTYGSYTALGDATVTIANGRLQVTVPDGAVDSGLRFRLPPAGVGVRCSRFGGLDIPDGPIGSKMTWTWFGFDDADGSEVVVAQIEIEKTGSLTIRHTKENGEQVVEHFPDKDYDDIKTKRWDTRRNGTEVQLEIEWKDGTEYTGEWVDPPASTIAGADVTTDLPEFSAGNADGTEVHAGDGEVDTMPTDTFDRFVGKVSDLYWLLQAKDAENVIEATVYRVREKVEALPGEEKPRLAVEYFTDRVVWGDFDEATFVVHHALEDDADAERFRAGQPFILFLRRAEELSLAADWLWDYGQPTGVVPYSEQNSTAIENRVQFVHGGASE